MSIPTRNTSTLASTIYTNALAHVTELPNPLGSHLSTLITQTEKVESRVPVVGLAELAAQTLYLRPNKHLMEATLWGWLAYSQADSLVDTSTSSINLSGSLYCTRAFTRCCMRAFPRHPEAQMLIEELVTQLDCTIAETAPTTDPHAAYTKSSALILPFILPLVPTLGLEARSHPLRTVAERYLAALQLHDDARDWLADREAQQPTYVTELVGTDTELSSTHRATIVATILQLFAEAREAAASLPNPEPLNNLLAPLEDYTRRLAPQ
jgi:hypothetical protein